MSEASRGFARSSHRLGVIPLVLFVNRSGHIAWKSGNSDVFTSALWSAATPFTLWLPVTARWAIRRFGSGPSPTSDIRCTRDSSPGHRRRTSSSIRRLIS
jgi:hypothetical protein